VRLLQGDYSRETIYGDDPVATASGFIDAGAVWVHVVDLDAARGDGPVNRPTVQAIASLCAQRGVRLETGGGVRTVDDARALFDAGVARVVIGTAAVRNPDVVSEIVALGLGSVAVGLDVHLSTDDQGHRKFDVAVQGWTQASGLDMFDVLRRLEASGVTAVVATDISRDGMLVGPSLELYEALRTCGLAVVASGGVSSTADLIALRSLGFLEGAIAGKAIYEGLIDVGHSVNICRGDEGVL
jgi:phosphoribosylformimino-5-aminoimidazole carboxamide ribotide isomerase